MVGGKPLRPKPTPSSLQIDDADRSKTSQSKELMCPEGALLHVHHLANGKLRVIVGFGHAPIKVIDLHDFPLLQDIHIITIIHK